MATEPRKRLGRELDALLSPFPGGGGDESSVAAVAPASRGTVPVAMIEPNPRNPRRAFRSEDLDELAASLKQHGLVQPIVVRAKPDAAERYEIIAGERRWRAAQLAGLHDIPVTVLDVSDRQALELAIVENVQRTDLNPVEEAQGYQALLDEFGYTQAELAETIGKSRVYVTNSLRLLRLPQSVLGMLTAGTLSAGHGRALLAARNPEALARSVAERSLSVRETERLAQLPEESADKPARRVIPPARDADVRALEKELSDYLGLRVEVRHGLEGRGELRISYRSLEQLDAICRRLRS